MENQINDLQPNIEKKQPSKLFTCISWAIIVILLFALVFFIYTNFFCMKISIEGSSMSPTLENGEEIIASRFKKAKVGDVVVIAGEKKNELIIKRVIATEGQTVKIQDGYVFIDGKQIDEPYLKAQGKTDAHLWMTERTLKENEVFYLGDNRMVSEDSRSGYGTCSIDQIVGVVPKWAMSIKGTLKYFI